MTKNWLKEDLTDWQIHRDRRKIGHTEWNSDLLQFWREVRSLGRVQFVNILLLQNLGLGVSGLEIGKCFRTKACNLSCCCFRDLTSIPLATDYAYWRYYIALQEREKERRWKKKPIYPICHVREGVVRVIEALAEVAGAFPAGPVNLLLLLVP